jgi:hypothetical protein
MTLLPHLLRAAAVVTLTLATTAEAAPRRMVPLSLEWVVTKGGGGSEVQRVYLSRDMVRVEDQEKARDGFLLFDLKSGDGKIVLTSRKAYVDWPRDPDQPSFAEQLSDPCHPVKEDPEALECRKAGASTVEGRRTEVWRISAKDDPELVQEEIHFDPELGIALKRIESSPDGDGPGETSVARKIQVGDPPRSLFTVPAGFRKMSPEEFGAEVAKEVKKGSQGGR